MDVTEIGKALSSETRIKILRLLAESPQSSIETYEQYERKYEEGKHRETIYRELENLVEAGLLAKEYNQATSQIEYSFKHQQLLVDLSNISIEPYSTDNE